MRCTVDCPVAAIAIRTGSTVLHRDRGFARIPEIIPALGQASG